MARIQLQFGKDEKSKNMAQKTIDNQSKEVDEMGSCPLPWCS
jgi:uncharacterized protein (DUF305 family)